MLHALQLILSFPWLQNVSFPSMFDKVLKSELHTTFGVYFSLQWKDAYLFCCYMQFPYSALSLFVLTFLTLFSSLFYTYDFINDWWLVGPLVCTCFYYTVFISNILSYTFCIQFLHYSYSNTILTKMTFFPSRTFRGISCTTKKYCW